MRPTTAYITSSYGARYLPTYHLYIHYSKKCFASPAVSGSAGSVRVIDGQTAYFYCSFMLAQSAVCFSSLRLNRNISHLSLLESLTWQKAGAYFYLKKNVIIAALLQP